MGNKKSKPKAPQAPPKTTKELIKEMKNGVNRTIREFSREKNKLVFENKKIKREIENMVKKNESRSSQKILAQTYIKNEKFIIKYENLEAKMKGVKVQIETVGSTEALIHIFKDMGTILGKTMNSINVNNLEKVMEDFNFQMEKAEGINEMISDTMEVDEEVDDDEADNLINEINSKQSGGNGGGKEIREEKNTNFDNELNDLKL